jgi:HEAT repeat protein
MIHLSRSMLSALSLLLAGSLSLCDDSFVGKTPQQWKEQLSSAQPQSRVEAAWAIAQIAGRSASDPQNATLEGILQQLVRDADPSVRYWGTQGLAMYAQRVGPNVGGQAAAIRELEPLLNDKSPAPRIAAAGALGLLGKADKALPVLTSAMDDPQDSVRIQAVAALEKLGPAARPAISTLEKAMSDPSEYVKRISERSLASLGVESKQSGTKAKAKKAKAKAKSPL